MGSHDIHLVDAETEAKMYKHVEQKPPHTYSEKSFVSSAPCTCHEKQHQQPYHNIGDNSAIGYEYRPILLYIAQQIGAMKHDRFAEKVFYYSLRTRCGDVCPFQKRYVFVYHFSVMCLFPHGMLSVMRSER